jgi:GT2 family glycosyltransferase
LKKVSVNILNFNHIRYLKRAIPLILAQTYPEIEITLIDNASGDGSIEYVQKNFPSVRIIRNHQNLGYVGGHNRGIDETDGEYVLLLNPDIFMLSNFIEEKVKSIQFASDVGMAEGKLLQINFNERGFPVNRIIDSTGLVINRMRKNYDRGHGEKDVGQYDREEFVFGPSGASPLYRRKMLEDVRIENEYFDSTFFMYREEVDLAWRAQLLNWKCRYTPNAIAYHVRSYSPRNRKLVPKYFRQLQFRNRYLMMLKMESLRNLLAHLPYLLLYEFSQFVYVLFREPHLLLAFKQLFKLLPEAWRKRKIIAARKRVPDAYMLQWCR